MARLRVARRLHLCVAYPTLVVIVSVAWGGLAPLASCATDRHTTEIVAAWVIGHGGSVTIDRAGVTDPLSGEGTSLELFNGDVVITGSDGFVKMLMRNGVEHYMGENSSHTIGASAESSRSDRGSLGALVAWLLDREPVEAPGWSRSGDEPTPAVLVLPRTGYVRRAALPTVTWLSSAPLAEHYHLRLLRDPVLDACAEDGAPVWTHVTSDTSATLSGVDPLPETSYRLELRTEPEGDLNAYGCFTVAGETRERRIDSMLEDIHARYGSPTDNPTAAIALAGALAKEEYFADAVRVLLALPDADQNRPAVRRLKGYVFWEVGPALLIPPEN